MSVRLADVPAQVFGYQGRPPKTNALASFNFERRLGALADDPPLPFSHC